MTNAQIYTLIALAIYAAIMALVYHKDLDLGKIAFVYAIVASISRVTSQVIFSPLIKRSISSAA